MTEFCDLSKECHVFYLELLKYCIALYLIHMKLNLRGTLDWMNTNLKLEIWSEISKGICNKKKKINRHIPKQWIGNVWPQLDLNCLGSAIKHENSSASDVIICLNYQWLGIYVGIVIIQVHSSFTKQRIALETSNVVGIQNRNDKKMRASLKRNRNSAICIVAYLSISTVSSAFQFQFQRILLIVPTWRGLWPTGDDTLSP